MNDKTAFPSDAADKVLVRMPDGMRDRLKEAAKANNRTMNAEIVARLQSSFENRSDPDWQLRVALHTNEVRRETLSHHSALLEHYRDRLMQEILNAGELVNPRIKAELQNVEMQLREIKDRREKLLAENAALELAKRDADREMVALLDRLADGAIQDDLRALHAAESRLGVPAESRGAITPTAQEKTPIRQPMTADLSAYEMLLETALAKRDEKIRSWWQKEFGYDPDAPKVERPASKGPVRSPNAKKPRP